MAVDIEVLNRILGWFRVCVALGWTRIISSEEKDHSMELSVKVP